MSEKAKITKDGLVLAGQTYPLAPITSPMMNEVTRAARVRAVKEFHQSAVLSELPKDVVIAQVARISSARNVAEIMTGEDTARMLYLRAKAAGAAIGEGEIQAIPQAELVEMEDAIFGADPEARIVIKLNPKELSRLDILAREHGLGAPELCLYALGDLQAWQRAAELKRQNGEKAEAAATA